MSQDFNLTSKNLEKLLGNIPDEFKDILTSLTKKDIEEPEIKPTNNFNKIDMFMQLKNMFDSVDGCKDDKIELIQALKPFLKPSRQIKINQCIKILRLTSFAKEALALSKLGNEKNVKGD